jgi:serine protease
MRTSDDQQHDQQRDLVDAEVSERDDGLSGFVILRLARHVDPGEVPDLREHANNLGIDSIVKSLDDLGQPPTRRVIISLEPRELLRLEKQAKDNRQPPLPSLTRYWRIDARRLKQPLQGIVERFSSLDDVELAYAEMAVTSPNAGMVSNPRNVEQGYLDAAPKGIDARWAWQSPSRKGRGQRVGAAVIERGWRPHHEDLVSNAPTLIKIPRPGKPGLPLVNEDDGNKASVGHHGTNVMGVIAADNNTIGVIGIAHELRSLRAASIFNKQDGPVHVADAVTGAWHAMKPGDVLLVEVQYGTPQDALPAEADPAVFTAIRLATDHHRIVVEPAGNGTRDLDHWYDDTDKQRRRLTGQPEWDSGAIMVGACKIPDSQGPTTYERYATSNYGERVNCFAWGDLVTTCGGSKLNPNTTYTNDFNGTSSAAAIIAGAAVLTQSMNLARRPGKPLTPRGMRSILANPKTGTPIGITSPHGIGSMPNLKLIKTIALNRMPRS